MIDVVQGSPGSGKSAVAVARAIMHLKRGGVVAANFSLVDGWAESVAAHSILGKFSPTYAANLASSLHKRFYRVDSLSAIRAIDPRKEAVDLYADDGEYSEGSGLLLLDEAQLIFNSRKWDKNFDWMEFFTQHRKLGWNVVLIAHSIEMIDSQIRPLAEFESRFRNLQKVKIPGLGVAASPFPLFLVVKRYAGLGPGASSVAGRSLYPLPVWAARLYDSLHVFSAEAWGRDTSPKLCGPAPSPPCGGGAVSVPSPVRVSTLVGPHWDNYLVTLPGSCTTRQTAA